MKYRNVLLAILLAALLSCASMTAWAEEDIILEIEDSDISLGLDDDGLALAEDIPEFSDDMALDIPLSEELFGEEIVTEVESTVEANGYVHVAGCTLKIENGVLVNFEGYTGLEEFTIPSSVTAIGENAFSGWDGQRYTRDLQSIVIPDSVTSIGKRAFYYCPSLQSIDIPDSVTSIGDEAFAACYNLTNATLPSGVTTISKGLFRSSAIRSISIPAGVVSIEEEAFEECRQLESIDIPNSVTGIGQNAFSTCTALKDVSIPDSVTSIGKAAFSSCTSIKSIDIPDSVESLGESVFSKCSSLSDVNLPGSLTYIPYGAFSDCDGLIRIGIPEGVTSLSDSAFNSCSNLEAISLPDSLERIGGWCFDYCVHLKSVTLPVGVTYVGTAAFSRGLSDLKSVTILSKDIKMDGLPFDYSENRPVLIIACDSNAIEWAAQWPDFKVMLYHATEVTDPAVAPTCTSTGLTAGRHCVICNAVTEAQEVVPAEPHTPVVVPGTAPTCTKAGVSEGSYCSVCGEIIVAQEAVPAVGHTPVVDPAVAPTVKKTGLTEGSHCSVCGEVLVERKTVEKLISIKKCAITGIKDAVYTGKAIKSAPVVKYAGKKLTRGTDYTVKYSSNKAIGTATIMITGEGKYAESVKKTFKINPRAVALSALTPGARQLTVKWKKGTGITGYEVQYSLKKSFASAKTIIIKKAATVQTVLKKLTPKKTYYVQVRAFRTVKGKKYYSQWSKAKSAKVK